MTNEECALLKVGDKVWATINGDKVLSTVVGGSSITNRDVLARIRRIGHMTDGRRFSSIKRVANKVELHSRHETGNIIADFLEERGYTEAAILVRKNFPLV